jgi:hypothetical protein
MINNEREGLALVPLPATKRQTPDVCYRASADFKLLTASEHGTKEAGRVTLSFRRKPLEDRWYDHIRLRSHQVICEHRSSDDIRVGATGDGLVADLTYSVQIGIVVV